MNTEAFPHMLAPIGSSKKAKAKAKAKAEANGNSRYFPKAVKLHPNAQHAMETYATEWMRKQANLQYRHDMMQKNKTTNTINELDRVRGILHNHTVRMDAPQGELNRLEHRRDELKRFLQLHQ